MTIVRDVFPDTAPNVAVIVAEPTFAPVANPFVPSELLMLAFELSDELHVTALVIFSVDASEYVPVAVNCRVAPFAIDGLDGVTVIDTSVAAVTVNVVFPDTALNDAVIVAAPADIALARPLDPLTLLMVVILVSDELHVACVVKSWVDASENVPVAVNCLCVPLGLDGLDGVTLMDTNVAGVTVRPVVPDIIPNEAVIVVVPTANELARPALPTALLIVAFAVSEELHATSAVKSCVVVSENVPVAMNCCFVPRAMDEFAGAISIDSNVAAVMVSTVLEEIRPDVAVIVVVPTATEVTNPFDPLPLPMVAMLVSDELHVMAVVKSCVELSEKVPVA